MKIIKKIKFGIGLVVIILGLVGFIQVINHWIDYFKIDSDSLGAYANWATSVIGTIICGILITLGVFLFRGSIQFKR